jgi:hypothetical protein
MTLASETGRSEAISLANGFSAMRWSGMTGSLIFHAIFPLNGNLNLVHTVEFYMSTVDRFFAREKVNFPRVYMSTDDMSLCSCTE